MLDFVLHYPTITATFALAGVLAAVGGWKSVITRFRERRRKPAMRKRAKRSR